jgi:hypothetical protein
MASCNLLISSAASHLGHYMLERLHWARWLEGTLAHMLELLICPAEQLLRHCTLAHLGTSEGTLDHNWSC